MLQPFDILKVENNKSPVWIGAAETLEAARARIQELQKLNPAMEFVIFNQKTQDKIFVKAGDVVTSQN